MLPKNRLFSSEKTPKLKVKSEMGEAKRMTNVTTEVECQPRLKLFPHSESSGDESMQSVEEQYLATSVPSKVATAAASVIFLENSAAAPEGLGYFPHLPSLVQEHIISFVDRPQQLKKVCRMYRDVIVPNAIVLQVQRLQDNFRAVKALLLADIIDLTRYSIQDRSSAEVLHSNIANRLEEFFNRVSIPFQNEVSVFELIADPDALATCIFNRYLLTVIDILQKISPHFGEAEIVAQHLMDSEKGVIPSVSQQISDADGSENQFKSEKEDEVPEQQSIVPMFDAQINNSEQLIERAMTWARNVQERCALGCIPCFSTIVTDGTFKSSEQMWLPRAFLSCLSRVPLSLFGTLQMVGPDNNAPEPL
jgi:hypothetical protein